MEAYVIRSARSNNLHEHVEQTIPRYKPATGITAVVFGLNLITDGAARKGMHSPIYLGLAPGGQVVLSYVYIPG